MSKSWPLCDKFSPNLRPNLGQEKWWPEWNEGEDVCRNVI
jgi:hypothetical protein